MSEPKQWLKTKEVTIPDGVSMFDWAQTREGIWLNLKNTCRKNPQTGEYETQYECSTQPLKEGVVFSCLATEYRDRQEVRDEWRNLRKQLIDYFKENVETNLNLRSMGIDPDSIRDNDDD